ncbi:hypothetical protein CEN39_27870 [Fischerella thermalis CCMEE 5201]|nr:hypothetical protein CEN39_27870 [Fischerella thermalis CCMEE 5201]
MNKHLNVQSHAASFTVTFITFLIYFLAISAKVPIRNTVSTPCWEIIVEVNLKLTLPCLKEQLLQLEKTCS